MIYMDVIAPNKLLYRDFNSHLYGTEIMQYLLINNWEIDMKTHLFTFSINEMQQKLRKNINYSLFYETVLALKNEDVKIDDSTFSIFSKVKDPYNGEIEVEIHPTVINYFQSLREKPANFTKYHLYSLVCLSSPTSKKLYLIFNHFIRTGRVVNNQEGYFRIRIDQLREYLSVKDLYRGFNNFHKFFSKHVQEINKVTDFFVTITPEKKGKKYNSYNLYLQQNPIVKEKINDCFREAKSIDTTIAEISELKAALKQTAPDRIAVTYWLSTVDIDSFRRKLIRVPQISMAKIDDIITKIKANGFTSMKNYERWLIILDEMAAKSKKYPNPAGYVVQSLLKNNG